MLLSVQCVRAPLRRRCLQLTVMPWNPVCRVPHGHHHDEDNTGVMGKYSPFCYTGQLLEKNDYRTTKLHVSHGRRAKEISAQP